jgi:hypothetical protein
LWEQAVSQAYTDDIKAQIFFFEEQKIEPQHVLILTEAISGIATGLKNWAATTDNIGRLACALVHQKNNTVEAETTPTRMEIVKLKGLLTESGSELPLNCALWMAYLLSRGYYVGFNEHFSISTLACNPAESTRTASF